jgi:hypothetical protein
MTNGNEIATIPEQYGGMTHTERVARAIARGKLFGTTDENAALTLCYVAEAEGRHPATAFRDYHIMNGKPVKKAEAMHRDFLAAGGTIKWLVNSDDEVAAIFSHPQGGSVEIRWDNERIKRAGLDASPNHRKYPQQMKRARCLAEGVRTVWPSATGGMLEQSEAYDTHDEVLPAPHPLEKAANPRPIEVAAERPALPEPQAEVLAPQPSEAEKAAAEQAKAEAEKAERQRQEAAEKAELEAEHKRAAQWVADKKLEMQALGSLEAYDKFVYDNNRQVRSLARKFRDLHKEYQTSLEATNALLLDMVSKAPPPQEALGEPSAEYRILMSDIIICPDAIKLMALESDLEEMRPRLTANEIAEAESAIAGTRLRFA